MKRNAFLITAVLFSLATAATAAEQKKEAQPQSTQTEQMQVARYDADGSNDYASTKSDCMPAKGKQLQPNNRQDDSEGDPQASQNQVEYGGAG